MILHYRHVAPVGRPAWGVGIEAFHQQLLALRGRRVVHLDDYDPGDPEHVVIAFDGVSGDVLDCAAPMLRKFDFPFELFVLGDRLGEPHAFEAASAPVTLADAEALKALVSMGGRLQWQARSEHDRAGCDVPEDLARLDPNGFRWLAHPHDEGLWIEARRRLNGGVSGARADDLAPIPLQGVRVSPETRLVPKGRVSVIIASYNYGRFLPEAIESVLRQTMPPDEILIMDDGSEDETEAIGRAFAERHPALIRYHRNPTNLGIVDNFNAAVALTTGEYLCILGADNRFRSDYIEHLSGVLERQAEVAVAYTDFAFFGPRARLLFNELPDELKGRIIRHHFFEVRFPEFDEASKGALESVNFIHGSSMYRRSAFEQVGGYVYRQEGPEDHHLFLRMVRAGWAARRVPLALLEYRQHSRDQANIRTQADMALQFYKARSLELEARLLAHYQSTSWRVTRPLRFLARWLRKLSR